MSILVNTAVTPSLLPGDRVRFTAKAGGHEYEVDGVYQFMRCHSYVIVDDGGVSGSPEHVADEEVVIITHGD
jgi:hypothetical protein